MPDAVGAMKGSPSFRTDFENLHKKVNLLWKRLNGGTLDGFMCEAA